MDVIKQHFGVWTLEINIMIGFVGVVNFRKCIFPEGLTKELPKMYKSQNVWILLVILWFHPFPHANWMQQTPPMHLNTSPNCFEGPRTGKQVLGTRGRKLGFKCCLIMSTTSCLQVWPNV